MPTVVPGPKKSPNAPAGTRKWLGLVMGVVCVQLAFRQIAVALFTSLTGNEAMLLTKNAPGLLRLSRLKASKNGRIRPAIVDLDGTRDAEIDLKVGASAELVEGGCDAVDHGAAAAVRVGERVGTSALDLGDGGELQAERRMVSSGKNRAMPRCLRRTGRSLRGRRR